MGVVVLIACLAASAVSALRWLRVAQREHYEPGRIPVFRRLWEPGWFPLTVLVPGVVGVATELPLLGLPAAAYAVLSPPGLGVRGRTSTLAWTRRMKTLAGVTAVLVGCLALAPVLAGASVWIGAFLAALETSALVDLAARITRPIERRAAQKFVDQAEARLREVDPTIVAITGSYGKTTIKGYLRHLVEGARSVVASPASFNNTAGLSRTVNEQLTPGTQVFIAEMGAYGPGEIAGLCRWVRPDISAICAIGPVHLERYGTIERIVEAKSEILDGADQVVLNVDATGLAEAAKQAHAREQRVIRCSTSEVDADVTVSPVDGMLSVEIYGSPVATIDAEGRHPSNVAMAVGLALALGIDVPHVVDRLPTLPGAEHRQQLVVAASGVRIIDNTFNSNPASAATSLELLAAHRGELKRAVVVTPGMIELGPRQGVDNAEFAEAASKVATDLVVIGRTNRAALDAGHRAATAAGAACSLHHVATRDEAVEWVRANLTTDDTVLYENDLPDHYP